MHPNELRLRDGYAAMARGDGKTLSAILSPDAVWSIPGKSPLAGTYRGLTEIFAFWRRVAELGSGGMKLEVVDVLANDDRVVVFVVGRSKRKGLSLDERGLHVYEMKDGRAISGRFFYDDQDAYDNYWSA